MNERCICSIVLNYEQCKSAVVDFETLAVFNNAYETVCLNVV